MPASRLMITADYETGRVTIGRNPITAIRELSDSRSLACSFCGKPVVLKSGTIVRAHFAHLAGSLCSGPHSEPETEEHRTGKSMLAEWAAAQIPDAAITLEAAIAQSGQRADVLIENGSDRIALEYQCADLARRHWLRRHRLFRACGIRDLWILGASRLERASGLHHGDLESALSSSGAPLLVLDAIGLHFEAGAISRFKRGRQKAPASVRPLADLTFPWHLLNWPLKASPRLTRRPHISIITGSTPRPADKMLREWLCTRCGVDPDNLSPIFGIPTNAEGTFACSAHLWRAAIYYRFVAAKLGKPWQVKEVGTWARRFIPLTVQNETLIRRAIYSYQEILIAAGILSTDSGAYPQIVCDLRSLPKSPDADSIELRAAYRQSLKWEHRTGE